MTTATPLPLPLRAQLALARRVRAPAQLGGARRPRLGRAADRHQHRDHEGPARRRGGGGMSGLVLKLGPHERIMINGVVMENGDRRTRLNVLTPDANVLRLRDAIHPGRGQHPGAAGLLHRPAGARRRGRPRGGAPPARCAASSSSPRCSRTPTAAAISPPPPQRSASAASTRRCGRCARCCRARRGCSASAPAIRRPSHELPAHDPAARHRRLALPRAHAGNAAGGVREGRRSSSARSPTSRRTSPR